jgi:hypothetical protein
VNAHGLCRFGLGLVVVQYQQPYAHAARGVVEKEMPKSLRRQRSARHGVQDFKYIFGLDDPQIHRQH